MEPQIHSIHTHTHTQSDTDTQTHRHTDTQTHRYSNTERHRHRHIEPNAPQHTQTRVKKAHMLTNTQTRIHNPPKHTWELFRSTSTWSPLTSGEGRGEGRGDGDESRLSDVDPSTFDQVLVFGILFLPLHISHWSVFFCHWIIWMTRENINVIKKFHIFQ